MPQRYRKRTKKNTKSCAHNSGLRAITWRSDGESAYAICNICDGQIERSAAQIAAYEKRQGSGGIPARPELAPTRTPLPHVVPEESQR